MGWKFLRWDVTERGYDFFVGGGGGVGWGLFKGGGGGEGDASWIF